MLLIDRVLATAHACARARGLNSTEQFRRDELAAAVVGPAARVVPLRIAVGGPLAPGEASPTGLYAIVKRKTKWPSA